MTRYRRVCHIVGLLLLICATTPSAALKCPDRRTSPGRQISCYTSSTEVELLEDAICRCTMIVHQGHDLRSLNASGIKNLQDIAKEANPDLKVVISISDKHELLKNSATKKQEIAANLIEILKKVDGVELNITAGNKERLVSFIKDLKDRMVNRSMEKMIILELPSKPEDLAKQFELKELSKYVDVFTITTHYLKDSEETYRTFHPSRLMGLFDMLNTDSLVDLITGMGAPKHKILISVPANAYKFTLKKSENNTPRSLTVEELPLPIDRKKLCEAMNDGEWTIERDEDLTAPYAFKNTTWIAFEDEISLKIKGKYVILRDLAGLGLRNVENDLKNNCSRSLIQSVYQSFMNMKRKSREVVLSSLEKDLKGTEIAYSRHVRSSDFRIVRVVDTEGKIRAVRENTQTAFTCSRQGYFVHPKSCNRFYRCVKFNQDIDDYSVFEFDCPAGLAFDERTEVCVWPGSVSKGSACPGSSEIEPVPRSRFHCPSEPGFYADPQNCRWFFACYDLGGSEMVPYEFRCPFGLVFDEHRLICEWPWKVPHCNNPEHNNARSTYTYGNYYEEQDGYAPQERTIGQNGFIGQADYIEQPNIYEGEREHHGPIYNGHSAIGSGANYDENNYNTAANSGIGYDENPYNTGSVTGTEGNYGKKNYNPGNNVGPAVGYNGQTYNPVNGRGGVRYENENNYDTKDVTGTAINYDTNIYSNNPIKPATGTDEKSYNPAKDSESGIDYQGYDYNTDYGTGSDVNYDGKNYNAHGVVKPAIGSNEPAYYPIDNPEAAVGYPGHNTGGDTGPKVDYDGPIYNTDDAAKPVTGNVGQTYIPVKTPEVAPGYGQNYNPGGSPGTGITYDGNIYNTYDAAKPAINNVGQTYIPVAAPSPGVEYDGNNAPSGINYDDKNYNTDGASGPGVGYIPPTYNVYGATGPGVEKGPTFNNNGFEGPYYNVPGVDGSGVNCDNQVPVTGTNYEGQFFNPTGTGYNYGQNQGYPQIVYNNPVYINPGSTDGHDDNSNGYHYNVNVGNENHDKASTPKPDDCDDKNNTPINGDNNNKDTTYSDDGVKTTQFHSKDTVTTVGINNLNKDTYAPTGFTDGSVNLAGGSGLTTGYATGSTNGYTKNSVTSYPTGTTNGYGGHVNTGYVPSTVGITAENGFNTNQFDNTDQYGGTNSVVTIGNTNYPSTIGHKVYNSTYNTGSGFPTSTIIPFVDNKNTYSSVGLEGTTPINSMGLTSTEHFGNEYTNQAEKSFTTPGQIPTGYASHVPTQHFNTPTNVYDYSKINLDGVTPVITVIRDGQNDNSQGYTGGNNFGSSAITTPNFNYPTAVTNEVNNSPFIGQSITSSNNDITKFRESTRVPSNFRTNENTPGITSHIGSTVPSVEPTSSAHPEVELDNSGLFGVKIGAPTTPATDIQTNSYSSTTPQHSGYKTNEYYDNGGRGTIRYNNGIIASKVTDNDIPDYRPSSYTRIPNSFIISAGNGENEQSTIQKVDTDENQKYTTGLFTKEGFTKTGPTKTGITTAQVGGSGSYIIGTGPMRTQPNPQFIGEQAFAGNYGTTGITTNLGTTPPSPGISNNELLKFDKGFETPSGISGYTYPKPSIELEIHGTSNEPDKLQTRYPVTTPSPNVQTFNNENSVIIKTNTYNNHEFSTTEAPIKFTTNQLEKFRTTIQHMSTLPQTISTVKPEVEVDFGSVVSTTFAPAIITTQKQRYETKPDEYLNVGVNFDHGNDYISTIQGSTGSSDYSDITANFDQGHFGQKIAGQPIFTNMNHQQPTTNHKVENHNNELIKSTPGGYNFYTHIGDGLTTQTGSLHSNRLKHFMSTINLPYSTIAPGMDITYRKPIVAAEFSPNQFDESSAVEILKNNHADSNYRISSNQVPAQFSQEKASNKILINQAPRDRGSTYRGPPNKILNQVSAKLVSQEESTRVLDNQNTKYYGIRTPSNEIVSNLAFENSYSGQNQGFNGQTRTLIGSNVVTSIGGTNIANGFIPQNPQNLRIISEFNSANNKNVGAIRQSTTTAPEVTTYTGEFSKSSALSNSGSNGQNKSRKVIVKLSDLHPLILGKLSAECTCKADPFAIFRGPNRQTLPINSQNRGNVDLADYDESDIYVDVDNDKENQRDIELIKNIPSNRLIKPSKLRTNEDESDKSIIVKSRGEPTSTYLPPTRTSTLSAYLPPTKLSNTYLPSSADASISPVYRRNQASLSIKQQKREPLLIKVEDENINDDAITTSRRRSSKALFDQSIKTSNNIKGQSYSTDRSKSGIIKSNDNSLQDNLECARPGLFRHPKYCNKFYACHWDNWKKRYTLHVFNCPVHLAFDSSAGACNYPSKGPACQDNKLLV